MDEWLQKRITESVTSIQELVLVCNDMARNGGWYDPPRTFGDDIALIHSELSEALEEFRNNHETTETYYNYDEDVEYNRVVGKPEGIPIEFADAVIRIAQVCGYYGIDLAASIKLKLEYNATRAYRHGGKAL